MPKRRTPVDIDVLMQQARERLAAEGSLRRTALGPKTVRDEIATRLQAEGFEATKSALRRPLAQQLLSILETGAFVPLKSIGAHVRGATAAEAKRTALELVAQGQVHRILRTKVEVLAPRTASTLSKAELTQLKSQLDALSKTLTSALRQKPPTTLLQADVTSALEEALAVASPGTSSKRGDSAPKSIPPGTSPERGDSAATSTLPRGRTASNPWDRLLSALDASHDARIGLSFVPQVVRLLAPEYAPQEAQAVLLEAAQAGLLELRPEGGVARLSTDEVELCPAGPQGTRLSWARRLTEEA